MLYLRRVSLFTFLAVALHAAPPSWLDVVTPIISPAERKAYLALRQAEQEKFRNAFWAGKSITAEEYYRRIQYIDATYGSKKTGSGANTDPGRVYLSLGAPNRITRIPSSRIFVPLEIWYYETAPAASVDTEIRLIFYQKNAVGLLKLYSPALDTIRGLLLPEPGTIGMFGPNDDISEADIRGKLTVGPAEDEVLSAAISVAAGVTSTGNDEILSRITSPELILTRQRTEVRSRLILLHPKLETLQSPSSFGGWQVDLRLETELRSELKLEVQQGTVPVYQNCVHFNFAESSPITYLHRLDLLPGSYTVLLSVDGRTYPYPLQVPETQKAAGILRTNRQRIQEDQHVPFEFDGTQLIPDPEGEIALLPASEPGKVTWIVRRGLQIVSKTTTEGHQVALWTVPLAQLQPGSYKLEASTEANDYQTDLLVKPGVGTVPSPTIISYNANLSPALRFASIGHQWLLRGNLPEARRSLHSSFDAGITDSAEIELARADVFDGDLDAARERVRRLLAAQPKNFEALSVLAYIEAKFQDYPAAANLYRRALAVQDSAALRQALASLPVH